MKYVRYIARYLLILLACAFFGALHIQCGSGVAWAADEGQCEMDDIDTYDGGECVIECDPVGGAERSCVCPEDFCQFFADAPMGTPIDPLSSYGCVCERELDRTLDDVRQGLGLLRSLL